MQAQSQLFQPGIDPDYREKFDLNGAAMHLWPFAFSRIKATELMNTLQTDIPWRQETLCIAGQQRLVPRLQCWMGDPGTIYGYSGMRLEPEPWSDVVLDIRSRVEQLSGQQFNSVLLNLYRDEQDSVAWHSDDEKELGSDPLIASVSLGSERPFELKSRQTGIREKRRILLPDGSVLLMGNGIQTHWQHQLPKVKTPLKPRINLTFRTVLTVVS